LADRNQIRDSMLQGQALFARGDFSGSLKEYQRVLSMAPASSPSDLASFNTGLIYAHPGNPLRDHQKAVGAFQWVITHHPESPWVDQARIWIDVLEDLSQAKRQIAESTREIEKSNQALERSRREVELAKQTLGQSKQEIEKLRQEIEKSKQAFEKSRQVDIEIEQKRRVRGK
jgi:tetratricopeptide (TPR) repeat protein